VRVSALFLASGWDRITSLKSDGFFFGRTTDVGKKVSDLNHPGTWNIVSFCMHGTSKRSDKELHFFFSEVKVKITPLRVIEGIEAK
jgi:hypothetical protein